MLKLTIAAFLACQTLMIGLGTAPAAADELKGTIAAIKQAGTIRDCIDPEYPPEIYLKDNKPAGLASDLVEAMAKSLGVTVTYVQTDFTGLIAGLQANKCDIAFSGITARAKRAESATFAKNYLLLVLGLAVKADEPRAKVEDFNKAGTKICIVEGTSDEVALKSAFPAAEGVSLRDVNSCFLQLATGKVDGFIVDNSTGANYSAEHAGQIKMVLTENGGLQSVPSAIAVRYGDYELRDWVNVFLAEFIDAGGYEPLYVKNFKSKPDIQQLKIARGGF
jgi:polar amino acid transport system substrate-binding protein